jgi:hypothetical protein
MRVRTRATQSVANFIPRGAWNEIYKSLLTEQSCFADDLHHFAFAHVGFGELLQQLVQGVGIQVGLVAGQLVNKFLVGQAGIEAVALRLNRA